MKNLQKKIILKKYIESAEQISSKKTIKIGDHLYLQTFKNSKEKKTNIHYMFDNSLEKRHFAVHSMRAYLEHEYPINLIICYTFSNDYTNHLIFISSDTVISLIYFEKI